MKIKRTQREERTIRKDPAGRKKEKRTMENRKERVKERIKREKKRKKDPREKGSGETGMVKNDPQLFIFIK